MKWPMHSLKSVGIIQTGTTPSTANESYWNGETPFITPSDLDLPDPINSSVRSLSDAGLNSARIVGKNSVLICCIGSLGKIGLAGRSLAINQQINSISFDPNKVDYLYGYFACQKLKRELVKIAPATTIPIVSKSKFELLEIPIPPLPEQRRIAQILDKAEALRAKRRTALAKLDTLAQSIFLEMFGDPKVNPKKWRIMSLKEIGKIKTGGTPPSAKIGMFGGAIPFITPGDLATLEPIKRYVTEAGASEAETTRQGSALVCCIGATIGKMSMAPNYCAFNQQLNAVEWNSDVDDRFGISALCFYRDTIAALGASTTLPILKKSSFEKLAIPIPPLPLQQAFARRVEAIEALKAAHRASLAKLDALFASLQHRAFRREL